MFFYVNSKAIFCLALVATLVNFVLTQNLYTSILDDARDSLMSFSLGSPLPHLLAPPRFPVLSTKSRTSSSRRPKPKPIKKKRTSPSNKFLEAVDQIERAMYEAQAAGSRYRPSYSRLAKIKANIKLATQNRNYQFARQALGRGLFSAIQLAKRSGRKKRSVTNTAVKAFMNSIKRELGSSFDTFMSVNGDVTLMFAIDDTGSMSDDIQAAKAIATAIVNHARDEPVDYILSPFNDPGTGPVTYKEDGQGSQFISAIKKLKAHAGGDCPELTFEGMRNAIDQSPQYGSPLYVFTDATAKDYNPDKLTTLLEIAEDNGITLNFFTTGLCGRSSYGPFTKLAQETCGQLFNLANSNELKRLASFTAGALAGATCQATGGHGHTSGKKKRSVRASSHTIPVDDSTEKLIISVTSERMGPSITLKDPRGHVIKSGKIYLSKGAVYEINNPQPGKWKLTVLRAGKYSYQVKGSSKTNVDFEYFFIMIPTRGRSKKPIPISHPLLGQKALVIITVAGAEKINKNALHLDWTNNEGKRFGTVPLVPRGKGSAHFSASFTPPSSPFKLKLRGKTKRGYSLERSSRRIVHPSHALIRVLYAKNEFTVPAGGRGFVLFVVYNTGPTEKFDIKIKNTMGFVHYLRRSSILVRRGRKSYFSVTFRAGSAAKRGKAGEVLATIKGQTSKKTVGQVVRLMVV